MYSKKVILLAAKAAFLSIAWPVVVIGVLSLFAMSKMSLLEKSVFLLGFQVLAWLLFFGACILFHRRRMRVSAFKDSFLSKGDKERGQELGTYLEGW
ncbi:hypothetical protein P3339_06195 [Microbulbifer sp. MLAF003]|uniref:hypothetical protein n=1 Tax=unclassified Microbulbifer TaxID=2619833 RepID=UPI0024AE6F0E|nr:hypothetical protein [Microbulbifer sp. MLAF003]WHI52370.1 hypothetical protein P3339_06195 [Microbulbifer sp. MLAF003]